MSSKLRGPLVRTLLATSVAILVLAGCGGGSSKPAASAASTGSSSSSGNGASSSSASGGSIDPCKLTETQVFAIVAFTVTKGPDIGGQGGCDYNGSGNSGGSVTVTTVTFPSESDANVIRDGNAGDPVAEVPNAFIDVVHGTIDLYKGNTQVEVKFVKQGASVESIKNSLILLVKKFV